MTTGRHVAGRYRLLESIGHGGMGVVWRAHDELLDRAVAVKEVRHQPVGEEERAAFNRRTIREARAAGRISHPNVVVIHDVIEEDGHPWIVMQLVEARSLGDVMREHGPLVPERAAAVGLQVLEALITAHASGVLHRDVKPENVLLRADGRVVLTDFGIATMPNESGLTMTGSVVGTPAYMPPERLNGAPATPGSDLWSLGATLYAAVEGRSPFDRGSAVATMAAVLGEEPDPPHRAGPLREVIDGLLRKDPGLRIDVAETLDLLTSITAGHEERPSRRANTGVAVAHARGRHAHAALPAQPSSGPLAAPFATSPAPSVNGSAGGSPEPSSGPAAAPSGTIRLEDHTGQYGTGQYSTGQYDTGQYSTGRHRSAGGVALVADATKVDPDAPQAAPDAPGDVEALSGAGLRHGGPQGGQQGGADAGPGGGPDGGSAGMKGTRRRRAGGSGTSGNEPADEAPAGRPKPPSTRPTRRGRKDGPQQPRRRPTTRTVLIAAVVVAAVVALIPGTRFVMDRLSGVPNGWTTHEYPLAFTIALPPGWKEYDRNAGQVRFYRPGSPGYLKIDLTRWQDPDQDPMLHVQGLAYAFGGCCDYQRISLHSRVYRDRPAADWEYTWSDYKGIWRCLHRSFTTAERQNVSISWVMPTDRWKKESFQIKPLFDTFKLV